MDTTNPDNSAETVVQKKAADADGLAGQRILGRYVIRHLLGVGTMGHVLLVYDTDTKKEAAVKCVPPQFATSEPHMRAIRNNFELVQGLSHPHIAGLLGLERDPDNGQYYLIMELVRGTDLSQWLMERHAKNPEPLPIGLALGIAEQIASALDYAHSCPVTDGSGRTPGRFGILHRDLKPANVMVDREREYRPGVPYVKLVDFGLATQIQASLLSISLNMHNKLAGTPVYMAPEQWEGRTLTRGVDQWALAVMIHEMAVGHRPFDALTEQSVMALVMKADPPKPPVLSPVQWGALKVAFSVDRRTRYRSCVELVKAIAEADEHTSDTLIATVMPMPDEFAGLSADSDPVVKGSTHGSLAAPVLPPPPSSVPKWLTAAALVFVLVTGGLIAWRVSKGTLFAAKPTDPNTTPSITDPLDLTPKISAEAEERLSNSPKEKAHDALTSAMEQITDPNKKGSWLRTKTLLEDPVQNPLNSDHPSLNAATKLLKTANEELNKTAAFDQKLNHAIDELKANQNAEALVDLEAARVLWPESGRNDEIFQFKKQAREALAAQRAALNQKTLDEAWLKFSSQNPNSRNWAEIIAVLEPLLELEGNSNHAHFVDSQKLVNTARIEMEFQNLLAKGKHYSEVGRFEDALNLYETGMSQTLNRNKQAQLRNAADAARKDLNDFKSALANEAKK